MSQASSSKKVIKFWVDKFVSIGAAVVIIGALFKILHWKFANELLIVGMFTEAGIFLIYALLPPEEHGGSNETGSSTGTSKLDSTELIHALNDVKLSLDSANNSISSIGNQTKGMQDLDAKFAAMGNTLDQLNQYYGSLKNLSETMSSSVGEAARTKEELNSLANNLTELNAVYSNMIHAIKGK